MGGFSGTAGLRYNMTNFLSDDPPLLRSACAHQAAVLCVWLIAESPCTRGGTFALGAGSHFAPTQVTGKTALMLVCRFYQGRRTADDERQIGRWRGVAGERGRWKRILVKKIMTANKRFDDGAVSPVIRQTLLHWAHELTEAEFESVRASL